jgi:predicted peroxiredoxin
MPDNGNVVINLATGHEDSEKVTIAFLVATAALAKEKSVVMFLTKEAVRLALPGYARLAGATPLWEFIGDGATVFSY